LVSQGLWFVELLGYLVTIILETEGEEGWN